MAQDFIRRLTVTLTRQQRETAARLLMEHNMELYERAEDGTYHLCEIASGTADADAELCVSAADRDEAVRILTEAGLQALICEEEYAQHEQTPFEQAMESYQRKRKIGMIECLVVIVAVLLYYLIRTYS